MNPLVLKEAKENGIETYSILEAIPFFLASISHQARQRDRIMEAVSPSGYNVKIHRLRINRLGKHQVEIRQSVIHQQGRTDDERKQSEDLSLDLPVAKVLEMTGKLGSARQMFC